MLRFQLYECNGHQISLEREVSYLRNYVDLQRLRKDEKYSIRFSVSGAINSQKLAPLLFIPLVENAFKHISHHPEGDNRVEIEIKANEAEINLTVQNTKDNRKSKIETAGGIGMRNLIRRLELQYPDRHMLEIEDAKKTYRVSLTLKSKA
jgi:LytS/YehU family sensor histidine kinase